MTMQISTNSCARHNSVSGRFPKRVHVPDHFNQRRLPRPRLFVVAYHGAGHRERLCPRQERFRLSVERGCRVCKVLAERCPRHGQPVIGIGTQSCTDTATATRYVASVNVS
jgi:hypothetical protein